MLSRVCQNENAYYNVVSFWTKWRRVVEDSVRKIWEALVGVNRSFANAQDDTMGTLTYFVIQSIAKDL